jgi:hypothetical protein
MSNHFRDTINPAKGVDVCTIWPSQAAAEMGKMVEQCRVSDQILADIAAKGQAIPIKAGFAAETLHAETFNLDAILRESELRAFTDAHVNSPLARNDPSIDLVVMRGDQKVLGAQSKYFKTEGTTAAAFRETRDGVHHYKDADAFIGPADQLQGVKDTLRKTELKNQQTRPSVAEDARYVRARVTDRLDAEGVQSRPVTKKEAEIIARGDERGKGAHRRIQDDYMSASTLKQTVHAAGSAALITTVIAGSVNTLHCLDAVQKGTLSAPDAFHYILRNTSIAAVDSALKAGAATAAVSVAARKLPELFSGSMLQGTLAGGAIGGAAICAVDLVECLVLVAAGKMTMNELETRTGKNLFQTGAGVIGASIGATLGMPAGPVGALIGSLVGGMITSLAMTVAIDNHIEKPFRAVIENTETLARSQTLLRDSLGYLASAQASFAEFRIGLHLSERQFEQQMSRIDELGDEMRRAVDRL